MAARKDDPDLSVLARPDGQGDWVGEVPALDGLLLPARESRWPSNGRKFLCQAASSEKWLLSPSGWG